MFQFSLQSCRMCCLYLDPTVANFRSLEKEYVILESPPSSEPAPPPHVCPSVYRTLLSAVELLRPDSFALSSLWTQLKPVLVTHMEDAGFRYNEKKNRFKSNHGRVEAGKRFGSRSRKMQMGTNNADAEDGIERNGSGEKEEATIGNGFIKSSRLRTNHGKLDPAKKVSENGRKRKRNSGNEGGNALHGNAEDPASSEQMSGRMRCDGSVQPQEHVAQSVSDASGDTRNVAGESGGENSTDSGSVSGHSSLPRRISGSEMRRRSLLARRYVWNSHSSTSSGSTLSPRKVSFLNSVTVGKCDIEMTGQEKINVELRSTCTCLSPDVCLCGGVGNSSNIGSNPSSSTADKLDKNSNLHAEFVDTSNETYSRSIVNGNPSSCSNAVKSKDRASSLGGWASKFLAYCSSISESEVEFEQCGESLPVEETIEGTVATEDLAVVTTGLTAATTNLVVVTSTSFTSVSNASSSVVAVSNMTADNGPNPSRSGFLESLSSPKVAYVSESQIACSTKPSEYQPRCSSALDLVAGAAEPSVSVVTMGHDVKPHPTALENVGLHGSAPVMTDTCQSSVKAVAPALDDMVSGSNSASHSKGASSDVDAGGTVTLPMTSEVESCRKSDPSTELFAQTMNKLSTTSVNRSDISETSVSQSHCSKEITSASIQGLLSSFPVSFCMSKVETASTDLSSFEEPVTGAVSAVSPSLVHTIEKSIPPPINTIAELFLNDALSGTPEVERASPVCPRNEEAATTSTPVSLDGHSDASSISTHPSFTSLPVETMPVVMETASDEEFSRVVYSSVPIMSAMEEVLSPPVELQAAVLADSVTHPVRELELESVVGLTAMEILPSIDESPAAVTPDSVAGFQQTAAIITDEISQTLTPPHNIIASSNEVCSDSPAAAGGFSASNTSLVSSQRVMEMLETVDQTVTCRKTKRHSADFVQRLRKILKPDSETISSSCSLANSSRDFAEMSAEPNAADRNEGPEDRRNWTTVARDVVVTKELFKSSESFGTLDNTSGNIVLNGPQMSPLLDHVSSVSVSKNVLPVKFQDDCIEEESDDSDQRLSEADNSHNVPTEQTPGLGADSTPILQADAVHVEVVAMGTNSTPVLQTDGGQTDQVVDGGQLMDLSIFNAPENEQHLLLYNGLRQESERNRDSHHMLAAIRVDDMTVPVLPSNLFYYERACPSVVDKLTNSPLPCGIDEGDTLCDTKSLLNLRESLRKVVSVASLSTPLDGGCAGDGFVEGGESLDDRQGIVTEPISGEEQLKNDILNLIEENSGKGLESSRESYFDKGHEVSMEPVASGGNLIEDQGTGGGKKISKGKRRSVDDSSSDRGTVGRTLSKGRTPSKGVSPDGESSVKGQTLLEENPSQIRRRSSGNRAVCVLCGKSLSSARCLRLHLIKLHDVDFVNRKAPEDGYRCQLCDQHLKLLSVCTCKNKSSSSKTFDPAASSEKLSKDSSDHFTSCHKETTRRSNDRKVSLGGNSGCGVASTKGKADRQSNDPLSRGKAGSSQSIKKRTIKTRNSAVGSSMVSGRDNNGGRDGSTERTSRKHPLHGAKKNTDTRNSRVSSDKKDIASQDLDSVSCRPRKRLFGEEDGEATGDSFPSAQSIAGEDSGRVNATRARRSSVKAAENSSQKRWRLRDRPKVKATT